MSLGKGWRCTKLLSERFYRDRMCDCDFARSVDGFVLENVF